MIWDFVVLYVLLTFAVAGWNIGFLNSWRSPIAMYGATLITQTGYLNFSMWLEEQTRLAGDSAVFLGYVVLWLSVTMILEAMMLIVMPINAYTKLTRPDKIGGALLGCAKGMLLLCFATLASVCAVDFPNPPSYPGIAHWVRETSGESRLLDELRVLAIRLPEPVVASVVSVNGATFRPTFETQTASATELERTKHIHQLFDALHDLQRDVDGF